MHKTGRNNKRPAVVRPPLPENLPPPAAVLFGVWLALLDDIGPRIIGGVHQRDNRLGLWLEIRLKFDLGLLAAAI